jgi:Amidohydrolase family
VHLGVTIRTLDGSSIETVVSDGVFHRPDELRPDVELDTSRWWALSGLADCHAHLSSNQVSAVDEEGDILDRSRANAWAQLEGGVFLVADKGTSDELSLRVLDEPPTRRPELHLAGRIITSPGGYFADFGHEVSEEELVALVGQSTASSDGRASWVKLIGDWPKKGVGPTPNFSGEAMARAVEVAHAGGRRVAIHACAPITATLAVAAGIDSIEHGLFLTADDLAILGRRGGAWVPTIGAMEATRDELGTESSGGRLFARGLDNVRELLAGAPEAGVTVLAGTDLQLPHGGVAAEALRLNHYGLGAAQVVEALTTAAYTYLGTGWGFDPGHRADVVFLDTDPHEDLSALGRPVLALRHGRAVVGAGLLPAGFDAGPRDGAG